MLATRPARGVGYNRVIEGERTMPERRLSRFFVVDAFRAFIAHGVTRRRPALTSSARADATRDVRRAPSPRRWLPSRSAAALLFAVLQLSALACRSPYRVDFRIHETLQEVHELLQEDRYTEAESVLDSIDMIQLNTYERALVYQMLGLSHAGQERYEAALGYFEKCLIDEALPHDNMVSARFSMAQLYMATEQFEEAVRTLKKWFKEVETPNANAYYLLAAAYFQLDQIDKAIAPAETAIKIAKKPKPPWLKLLVGLYYETKQYPKAVKPLEMLIALDPKEEYLTQLVGLLARFDRWEEVADFLDERTVEVSGWVLIDAAADGRSDVVKLLAARGADLDATSNDELTALHQAARGGHEETVRLLLDLGADPYATDASGRTAAQLAAESGHQAVARLLLNATRRD